MVYALPVKRGVTMKYYSIVFPSAASEARAGNCPWLTFRARRARGGYRLLGNKLVPVDTDSLTENTQIPAFFEDVALDRVLDEALPANDGGKLRGVWYALSTDAETVRYRQGIMRALETAGIAEMFHRFCRDAESALRTMADGETVHTRAQRDKYAVDGAAAYCTALRGLLADAAAVKLPPGGLLSFVEAVRGYAESVRFRQAEVCVRQGLEAVEKVAFRLRIEKGKVIVTAQPGEGDFIRDTLDDFALLDGQNGAEESPNSDIRLFGRLELCPLGALIADALQNLRPAEFVKLRRAAEAAGDLPQSWINDFLTDIRFYFGYLAVVDRLREKGLPFAYPLLSCDDAVTLRDAFDFALALEQERVVPNGLTLAREERGAVITGANHSGKTTFLRAVGQIAALTVLGLPVPGAYAELPLFTGLFSHFSDAEERGSRQGRLKEELLKLKPALERAGSDSLVLLNEMFSSTTAWDAQTMTERILDTLADAGARVLCVSHTVGAVPKRMVSLAAQVNPRGHERLYRIVRAPAETHAYADELAEKYRLTYAAMKERISHGV